MNLSTPASDVLSGDFERDADARTLIRGRVCECGSQTSTESEAAGSPSSARTAASPGDHLLTPIETTFGELGDAEVVAVDVPLGFGAPRGRPGSGPATQPAPPAHRVAER